MARDNNQGRRFALGALFTASVISGCAVEPTTPGDGAWVLPDEPTATGDLPAPSGAIMWEYFDGVATGSFDEMRQSSLFSGQPQRRFLMSSLELPRNLYDNYTIRLRGYLRPATTGSYRLYIRGSNVGAVWLSTDESPANLKMMANFPTSQLASGWMRTPSQQSPAVQLEAGKSYYLEAVQANLSGNDWFGLAWAPADADPTMATVLKGDVLAPLLPAAVTANVLADSFEQGYRVGYNDGRYGFPVNSNYPPLDSDGDGLPDNWEIAMGMNPKSDEDALLDQDGDGLYALIEWQQYADPRKTDSDGDGMPDGWELSKGLSLSDPTDAALVGAAGISYLALYWEEANIPPPLKPGEARVNWVAPATKEDGLPLDPAYIAGYEVIFGSSPESMTGLVKITDPKVTTVLLTALDYPVVYVSVVAIDMAGRRSSASLPAAIEVAK